MPTIYDCEECSICTKREELIEMTILCKDCGPDLMNELVELRKEKEIWRRICEFEKKRQQKFYDVMFIKETSDFGTYLKYVKELAGDE